MDTSEEHDATRLSRRRILKQGGVLCTVALIASTGARPAFAAQQVDPSSQLARSLNYVEDASQSQKRQNADAYCHNCQYFQGESGAQRAPCIIFGDKTVPSGGWCSSWVKRS